MQASPLLFGTDGKRTGVGRSFVAASSFTCRAFAPSRQVRSGLLGGFRLDWKLPGAVAWRT
jgi:hypothetical protein